MKVIHGNQTEKFKNSGNCIVTEYPLGDKDINGAVVEISGRYPDEGRVVNFECKELAYIIKGSGRVVVEEKEINLSEGDLVLLEAGEKYFWDGILTMFVPCTPAWSPQQHKAVE